MTYTIINGSVTHDNKIYQENATLPSIGAGDAAILLELGVIVETQPTSKVSKRDD